MEEVEELKRSIMNEVESIADRRILILVYLYARKLNERQKERELR